MRKASSSSLIVPAHFEYRKHKPIHLSEHSFASTYLVYLANYLSSQVIPSNDVEVREVLSGVTLSDRFRISPNHIVRSCRTAEDTAFEVMDALGMVTFDNSEAV